MVRHCRCIYWTKFFACSPPLPTLPSPPLPSVSSQNNTYKDSYTIPFINEHFTLYYMVLCARVVLLVWFYRPSESVLLPRTFSSTHFLLTRFLWPRTKGETALKNKNGASHSSIRKCLVYCCPNLNVICPCSLILAIIFFSWICCAFFVWNALLTQVKDGKCFTPRKENSLGLSRKSEK